ncbi:MAG TPA: hypothetical protein VH083_14600 [Myxococcales bacterium]|nr:hypothetical protein [Myxococcales bacterium]
MIATLLLIAASFQTSFPQATVVEVAPGGQLLKASGFAAKGLGTTPQAAAAAFLKTYGSAFGVTDKQKIVARGAKGKLLRFERMLGPDPIFEADLLVGMKGNDVVSVETDPVPAQAEGSWDLSKADAEQAAFAANPEPSHPPHARSLKGWKSDGTALRPAWRVDLYAGEPVSDWRTYLDAHDAHIMLRYDLKAGQKKKSSKPDLAL